ncbi:YaiO family outer membrane beta-barrel protein [Eudoraea chungangensis]|uniref:YaiO family outer membrane beta-barrel protein n=1 Tax=Eudoraea chungangensis TaxID=1481905 RepID=UPI0023ECCCE1|nr:YaiO family outer membrane beta-barrel protein [Eudoraea chungangensis]
MLKNLLLGMMFLIVFSTIGQELAYNGNPDNSFFIARDLAFNGEHSAARDTLSSVLTKYPDYADVRNLLAKTHSWDGQYNKARKEFNRIISVEKTNKEVWVAAIKNEIYAKNYSTALGLSNKALLYLKEDVDLLNLQKIAYNKIYELQKETDFLLETKEEEVPKMLKNKIGFINSFDVFDIVYDPMIFSTIEFTRTTEYGKVIPRVTYANRFNANGLQFELDAYPKISKTLYAYTNYGYSNHPIFPKHRAGLELYANLPKAYEASLGMRYLDFETSAATIYTGSVGMYKGNYYFSIRPYITPRQDGPIGLSGNLLARKYLKNKYNYFGLNFSYGFTPEIIQLISNSDVILSETLLFVESQQLLLEYAFQGKTNTNQYRGLLGLTRQEFVFDAGQFFYAISAGLRYETNF